ncbi:butyrophilin subfamily 2 member A1-like [Perca flavescens]|uniref:butyrophilin subfamily 2 member A1-like n=1 Tax=Perca flavescens TaxID=8167 RepID=UPI00106E7557|nr:butyrophilin subfamily 2 member A1-like [Perca flavescens]XP_028420280.1 butyrophilin subfamily 2 member A1-like [Perca flavescens]XP_028420282.1 butyrophilin subfamily 2 member A1-like [Perca flavescens]
MTDTMQKSYRKIHQIEGLSVLVFCLLLTHSCRVQSLLIGPIQSVLAAVGENVILPCHLEPAEDVTARTLEWTRSDLDPRLVHVWRDGQDLVKARNPFYRGRTSLFTDELKRGNISLKLSNVQPSDQGTYKCDIPLLNKHSSVKLVVVSGVVLSSPVISLAGIDEATRGVVLQCESEGCYPEPEVLWLDGEGNLLPAGPPETVRGPDDLYTVSSRVTVEKRHSNSFTCRVQQKNTYQTRESHIYVSEDFFVSPSSCSASVAMSVLFGLMFVLTVVLFVWKWRRNKIEIKKQLKNKNKEAEKTTEQQGLMEAEERREQLMIENKKIKKELQKKDKDMTKVIDTLTELGQELKKQKEQLSDQQEKVVKQVKENEDKFNSVEKEVSEKEGDKTANKAQGYLKLKDIITQNSWNLEERKQELQQLGMNTDKLMKRTYNHINRIIENLKE